MQNNAEQILSKKQAAKFFRMGYTKFVNLYLRSGKLPLYQLADNRTVILLSDCIATIKDTNPVIKNIRNSVRACPVSTVSFPHKRESIKSLSGGEISVANIQENIIPLAFARRGARAVPDGRRGEV